MPLPQINLDTRRFDDLVAEMRALIPRYAPEWTDHNPSDPGITLLELLAWITEATLYRINQIPQATYLEFAKLLLGHIENAESLGQPLAQRILEIYRKHFPSGIETDSKKQLEAVIAYALKMFNEPYRAVTDADFVSEALRAGDRQIARVRVVADPAAGQVVVVVVPAMTRDPEDDKFKKLIQKVKAHLDQRRLVATRVIVRGPVYTALDIRITAVLEANTTREVVKQALQERLEKFLHHLKGGRNGNGWPFGRPVSIFELYQVVEAVAGIDHVERLVLNGDNTATEVAIGDLPELQPIELT